MNTFHSLPTLHLRLQNDENIKKKQQQIQGDDIGWLMIFPKYEDKVKY
jgi:hypothetical protein